MNHNSILRVVAACGMSAWLLMMIVGCDPKGPPSETSPSAETQSANEGHDHDDHDHGHAHEDTGPHGGHVVEIGDEQLHAEWTHDDASGEVVVYLLDSTAKSDATISAATISIKTKIGETEKTYELPAISQEDGQSSRFALSDPSMVEALKAVGPGVEATVVVNVDGEALVGKFEQHEHDAHKH
ncbi:MAG: hypothetical protein QF918_04465 [Pirellulaceae bacterium]|jgi:hypothetical protein|nr:hypothetical protein [Pirellulaceae bacterium]MDP6553512.1 hypothetical protein [Pirellulaceae bacterium]